ncbi:hypothetical protein ACU4GD_17200 [Cupriavidus basilensis]
MGYEFIKDEMRPPARLRIGSATLQVSTVRHSRRALLFAELARRANDPAAINRQSRLVLVLRWFHPLPRHGVLAAGGVRGGAVPGAHHLAVTALPPSGARLGREHAVLRGDGDERVQRQCVLLACGIRSRLPPSAFVIGMVFVPKPGPQAWMQAMPARHGTCCAQLLGALHFPPVQHTNHLTRRCQPVRKRCTAGPAISSSAFPFFHSACHGPLHEVSAPAGASPWVHRSP